MTEENKNVRVRFAPSPTGYMHVGNFRTALYNYLFAKKRGGSFLIRIEDTDQTRFVEGAAEQLLEVLDFMGLKWDEGNFLKTSLPRGVAADTMESTTYPKTVEIGACGPYAQSERTDIYRKYAEQLVREGKAYYCFCEPARLEEMRTIQQKEKKAPMYDRYCLTNLSSEQINEKLKEKCPAVIRLKVPKDEIIEFDDMVRGKVSFATNTIDDQVLLKSDGFPTYHLANVVDDHLMGITQVIRGEDWLPSTPKHILLYRAFGWEAPQFAHLPLLLNPDKSKLSKRQGDVAVEDYLAKGYLKEAIINFVALLGWNPGAGSVQEIFSLSELIENFELEKVHKAGAVFDLKKLDWINAQYIKKLTLDELYAKSLPFLEQKDFFQQAAADRKTEEYVKKVLTIERERLNKFSEVGEENKFFFIELPCEKELLQWKEMTNEQIIESLNISKAYLENLDEKYFELDADSGSAGYNLQQITSALFYAAEENYKSPDGKIDRGALLWPLRVALTGAQKSPSPFEVAWVLGKTEALQRIEDALAKCA